MRGTAYCLGVGPGDSELMTLKAVRLVRENRVIAVPGTEPRESVAYRIALGAVPELAEKELLAVDMPMTKDAEKLRAAHETGAGQIEAVLDRGENVVFLTLGDSTIYCTFSYLQHILERDGYPVVLVPGVPSFCAAAARLGVSLTEWDEPMHILPALHRAADALTLPGTCVLMKSAKRMPEVKETLRRSGRKVCAAENCTMENERLYHDLEEIPDDAGYFSLLIAKEQ